MGASDNLNPKQLKMFMTPQELKADAYPVDYDPNWAGGHEHMWNHKSLENAHSGLNDSVASEGVKEPVLLQHNQENARSYGVAADNTKPVLWNGHHRVQAADEVGGERYVPVTHVHDEEGPGTPWEEDDVWEHARSQGVLVERRTSTGGPW